MESGAHIRRVTRESDANQHFDSVEGAELSVSLYGAQLEELEVPTSGGNAEQSKQLKQLVDKWCCENEPIITSLRNTFESGGSGAERLEHVVASFIMPMQQQRPSILDQPHQGEDERWTAGSIRLRTEKRREVRKMGASNTKPITSGSPSAG